MIYQEAIEKLKDVSSPGELAELRQWFSGEYAFIAGQLEDILLLKPQKWLETREKVKSDTQAEREWQATVEGKNELIWRLRLKAIEKAMSAIKTRLEIISGESRNQF